jgi:hypothetical protein
MHAHPNYMPLLLKLYVCRLGEAGSRLSPRIESEIANHLGCGYLLGADLTGGRHPAEICRRNHCGARRSFSLPQPVNAK